MRRGNEAMLEAQRKQLALEHVRRELQIARQLQTSMIPLRGRLFPERADIEIAGMMDPASDVGGDFFDAFFADERHLFLLRRRCVGPRIPAALFMARAIGLIRIAAMGTRHPEQLLERINEQLCARNAANIFVTLFCAFLDVVSGRLVYANGGHCPAFLAHEGRASSLPMPKGALVGVMPGLRYTANEVGLDQGVALVCYTDGVTEAESAAGQAFLGGTPAPYRCCELRTNQSRTCCVPCSGNSPPFSMACRSPTIARLLQFAVRYDRVALTRQLA
jgi:sigma-B regulation protein RsbU (phosphoserine phosphatase)